MEPIAKALCIDRLSVADRLLLVEEIWDSIVEETESRDVPQSHLRELDRRLEERESNSVVSPRWDEV